MNVMLRRLKVSFTGGLHSDDDISLLMALLHIPVSLGDFRQGIAPIDDRLEPAPLNQLSEK